jgi:hypothetical protein
VTPGNQVGQQERNYAGAGAPSIQRRAVPAGRVGSSPISSASDSVSESTRVGTLASPDISTSEATYPRDFSGKELGLWRQYEAKTRVIPGTLAAKLIVRLK